MESLESKANPENENVSYKKFIDWDNDKWRLVTVRKEMSNYKSLKEKLINFKQYRIWNIKTCCLVGPSGNYYNISGKGRYDVVDKLDEMNSQFDLAFSEERDVASEILEEIKSLSRRERKYLLSEYLNKDQRKK